MYTQSPKPSINNVTVQTIDIYKSTKRQNTAHNKSSAATNILSATAPSSSSPYSKAATVKAIPTVVSTRKTRKQDSSEMENAELHSAQKRSQGGACDEHTFLRASYSIASYWR